MQQERSTIFRIGQAAFILALIVSVALCGCITGGTADVKRATASPAASIPANITPVPIALANNTSIPQAPVINTSTATPEPLPVNTTKNRSSSLASGLPPAITFTHVPAYGSNETLTGTVTGIDDPENYRLAIYVNSGGWYNVPSGDNRLTNISGDGTWSCNMTGASAAKKATEIDVFLVRAGFVPSKVTGRFGLPTDIRDNAVVLNSVTRKRPSITPAPSINVIPDSNLPNYIY